MMEKQGRKILLQEKRLIERGHLVVIENMCMCQENKKQIIVVLGLDGRIIGDCFLLSFPVLINGLKS